MAGKDTKGERYLLGRDFVESLRLNFQHYLWKADLGFNLHPAIKVSTDARIADVAMGTAIWALEVAEENPGVQIDGLDISLVQAPPPAWLPKSIQLHQWNMLDSEGPPSELIGKFDVVHLRLVVLAFQGDSTPLINNVLKLLKPGGYLQWDEQDFRDSKHVHPTISDPQELAKVAPATSRMLAMMTEHSSSEWMTNLPRVLDRNGFTDATKHAYPIQQHLRKFNMDLMPPLWDSIVAQMPDSLAERRAMLAQLVEGMKLEAAQGHVIDIGRGVTVARKKA